VRSGAWTRYLNCLRMSFVLPILSTNRPALSGSGGAWVPTSGQVRRRAPGVVRSNVEIHPRAGKIVLKDSLRQV
jgi:hypothetical protein